MSAESKTGSDSEYIRQMWAKVDTLLPEDYAHVEKPGYIDVYEESGNIFPRDYPRNRGGVIGNLISRALGTPPESYVEAYRSTAIGKTLEIPLSYPAGMTPKLGVYDHVYTPVNPVEGNTNAIRSTTVIFVHDVGVDAEYSKYEDGLTFKFLETQTSDAPSRQKLDISYHAVHPYYNPPSINGVRDYLTANELPLPYSVDLRGREAELLDFCVAEALKTEV